MEGTINNAIGFLCSRCTSSSVIMPSLEWAMSVSRGTDAVMSTFHSKMELAVLEVLAKGTCPIILVLGRKPYKRLPHPFASLDEQGRLQIVTVSNQPRIDATSARKCNEYICNNASQLVFGFIAPGSTLEVLYEQTSKENKMTTLLAKIETT